MTYHIPAEALDRLDAMIAEGRIFSSAVDGPYRSALPIRAIPDGALVAARIGNAVFNAHYLRLLAPLNGLLWPKLVLTAELRPVRFCFDEGEAFLMPMLGSAFAFQHRGWTVLDTDTGEVFEPITEARAQ